MSFAAKMRQVCKNCTESTIKTYLFQVRGLLKFAGQGGTEPRGHAWINDSLLKKMRKEGTLNQVKRNTIVAVKVLQALGVKGPKLKQWQEAMRASSDEYGRQRDKQKRTKREADNWPEGGYKAMTTLARKLRAKIAHLFEEAPSSISSHELYEMQRWFVFLFYSKHALRGDLGDVRIERKGHNYIYRTGTGPWSLHVGVHKTAKSYGAIDIKLDKAVSDGLKLFLPYVRAKTDHGYLLSTRRDLRKLNRKDMMLMIRKTTSSHLGKNIGIQLIRVMKTTDRLEAIDESTKLQREMGHDAGMQRRYVSRA